MSTYVVDGTTSAPLTGVGSVGMRSCVAAELPKTPFTVRVTMWTVTDMIGSARATTLPRS
jgi:hypothetical protein